MKKWLKRLGGALVIALMAAQLVPVRDRDYPRERGYLEAPAEVRALMQRSCNDCHSNETEWPWYVHVAPAKFLVARDVKEGREELNMSKWQDYDEATRTRKKMEIAKEVSRGEMPPWYYVPLHPEAKLSAQERELIIKWANPS